MKHLSVAVAALLLIGCGEPVLTPHDLNQRLYDNAASAPHAIYYRGSDDNYDYYTVYGQFDDIDEHYRVDRSKSFQGGRMPVTTDRLKWVIMDKLPESAVPQPHTDAGAAQ